MSDLWLDVVLVVALIGVNAMLAGSEMAFVALREGQIRRLAQGGPRGVRVSALAEDPNRYLSAVQLGITLAGFLASATVAVSMSEPVADQLTALGSAAQPVAVALVTVVVALVSLVFGELVPKRLAMQRAERWSLVAARPMSWFIAASSPLIVVLSRATDAAVRAFGGDPRRHRDDVTDEEIVEFVEAQSGLDDTQRQIMAGAIEIAARTLRQVLVPRNRVAAVDVSMPAPEALHLLLQSGHSRGPVIDGSLDETVGQVHIRDLISATGTVESLADRVLALPDSLSVLEALRRLQASRTQLAVVVDEHGGSAGIVTVEDLVEELVGEIYDEEDRDVLSVERDEDGALVLPGSFPVHDLGDVGVDLVAGGAVSVAGVVLEVLGHVPVRGEHAIIGGYDIEVLDVDRQLINTVRVTGIGGQADDPEP